MGWFNHQPVILCPGGLSYGLRATRQSYTAAAQATTMRPIDLILGENEPMKNGGKNRSLRKK